MRTELDGSWLEINVSFDDIELLRSNRTPSARWNPVGGEFVYLSVMDSQNKDNPFGKDSASLKHYAVLNGKNMEIDIKLPYFVICNQFIRSADFSKKLNNFKMENSSEYLEKEYGDMYIKLKLP